MIVAHHDSRSSGERIVSMEYAPHSAGVRALIAIESRLVILGGNHGLRHFSIGEDWKDASSPVRNSSMKELSARAPRSLLP
jgi:hypothetical protein